MLFHLKSRLRALLLIQMALAHYTSADRNETHLQSGIIKGQSDHAHESCIIIIPVI